jgi:hypothetical protein
MGEVTSEVMTKEERRAARKRCEATTISQATSIKENGSVYHQHYVKLFPRIKTTSNGSLLRVDAEFIIEARRNFERALDTIDTLESELEACRSMHRIGAALDEGRVEEIDALEEQVEKVEAIARAAVDNKIIGARYRALQEIVELLEGDPEAEELPNSPCRDVELVDVYDSKRVQTFECGDCGQPVEVDRG